MICLFFLQVFPGNTNAKDMLKMNLVEPVLALFIRFVPKEWNEWPCMRVEVYGKPASKSIREQCDTHSFIISVQTAIAN